MHSSVEFLKEINILSICNPIFSSMATYNDLINIPTFDKKKEEFLQDR